MKPKLPPEFDLTPAEQAWFHAPALREDFQAALKQRLRAALFEPPEKTRQPGWTTIFLPRWRTARLTGMLAAVLLALLVIAGVAYAVSRVIGYIPGIGLVPADEALRELAAPVYQTQQGITVQVTSAVFSPEGSALIYSLQGVPESAYTTRDPMNSFLRPCTPVIQLRLADGQTLEATGSGKLGLGKKFEDRSVVFFNPLPDGADHATFWMSCIQGAFPGKAPENWALPLTIQTNAQKVPAAPVFQANRTASPRAHNSIEVSEMIPLDGQVILIGRYRPPISGYDPHYLLLKDVSFADAQGNALPFHIPGELHFHEEDASRFAYLVDASPASFPLTMRFDSITYGCPTGVDAAVTVDEAPADGQVHALHRSLSSGECPLELVSALNNGKKITLKFASGGQRISDILVRDVLQGSGSAQTRTQAFGATVNATLDAENLMQNRRLDLRIDGVIYGPLDPLSVTITLQEFR